MKSTAVKVAILDLYDNEPNQGLRCIKELIAQTDGVVDRQAVTYDIFETRYKAEVPGLDYDIYISTGGPGSPFDGEGKLWERRYFHLIDRIWNHNRCHSGPKKYVFFICHSFQMMARFFGLATVRKRNTRSFGIIPIQKTPAGHTDPLLSSLPQPYYAADFRQYEVVEPDYRVLEELGARVLSREYLRKDSALEKGLMAIRISNELVGCQYHPEADPFSMMYHFRQLERKRQVVSEYGEEKYDEMIRHLEDPDNINLTRQTILPRFLRQAIEALHPSKVCLSDAI